MFSFHRHRDGSLDCVLVLCQLVFVAHLLQMGYVIALISNSLICNMLSSVENDLAKANRRLMAKMRFLQAICTSQM